ncbi:MAG: hypothetical protein ACJAS3_002727 [Roseivirga sp.]|jgi:hypothetical protein
MAVSGIVKHQPLLDRVRLLSKMDLYSEDSTTLFSTIVMKIKP